MRQAVVNLASQPYRNYAMRPRPTSTTGYFNANGATMAIDATTGLLTVSCPANGVGDSGLSVGLTTPAPGRYVFSVDVSVPSGSVGDGYRLSVQGAAVAGPAYSSSFTPVTPGGGSVRLSLSFTVVNSAASIALYVLRQTGTLASTFAVQRVAVMPGTVDPGYGDGDTLGWRWTGTPGASESVGYPPLDVRQLGLSAGPIYGDATSGFAGVYSTPAYTGPTGTPVGRTATTGNPMGWGVYLAANLSGATIPAGTPIKITWYERGSGGSTLPYEIVTDPAGSRVAGVWNTAQAPDPLNWVARSFSSTAATDWVAGSQRLRVATPPPPAWVEMSDVKLFVGGGY